MLARPKTKQVNVRLSLEGYDLLEECRGYLDISQADMVEAALRRIHPELKYGLTQTVPAELTPTKLPPPSPASPKSQAQVAKEFREREAARLGVCPGCGNEIDWCEGLKGCPKGDER